MHLSKYGIKLIKKEQLLRKLLELYPVRFIVE